MISEAQRRGFLSGFGATPSYQWADPTTRATWNALAAVSGGAIKRFGTESYANSPAGTPSTLAQIMAWGDSSPAGFHLSYMELLALFTAGGWAQGTCPGSSSGGQCVFNILETRYAKLGSNGHWINRNNNGDLGQVIATSSDPSHTIVGNITSDIGTIVDDIGHFLSSLPAWLAGALASLIKLIAQIVSEFGGAVDGLIELGEFILSIAGDLVALVDPTGTSASRRAAFDRLSPTYRGGAVYNFITSDSYLKSRHLLALIIVAPFALFAFVMLEIVLGHISPQLAQALSPANIVEAVMDAIKAIVQGIANGDNLFNIVGGPGGVINALLGAYGIQASPACVTKIAYQVILGLPIPPIAQILVTLLSDPVAQQSLANLVGVQGVTSVLPVAMACFDAADGGNWLVCFQGLIEAIFPKLISGLSHYAINLNDLRVVVQSVWETGGDLELMLRGGPAGSGPSFSGFTDNLTPVQGAIISIGFFGVDFIAGKLGIANADGFFLNTFGPLMPSDIRAEIQAAYDVFRFLEALIIEAGHSHVKLTSQTSPAGFVLYVLEKFHTAKWDVEICVGQIIADEFDPSPGATRFFTSNLSRNSQGKFIVTPALKTLLTKLVLDFPRLNYQLVALSDHLGIADNPNAIGTRATVDAAVASGVTAKMPASPTSVTRTFSTGIVHPQPNVTGADAGITAGKQPASSSSSAFTDLLLKVAEGAAAGALIGGPAGALVGAGAGLLISK